MKKIFVIVTVFLIIAFIISGCTKKEDAVDSQTKMIGSFKSDKAELVIGGIRSSSMGDDLDFQLNYTNDKASGTLFGDATGNNYEGYTFQYESLDVTHTVHFKFNGDYWTVKYTPTDTSGKLVTEAFDYTGVYKPVSE